MGTGGIGTDIPFPLPAPDCQIQRAIDYVCMDECGNAATPETATFTVRDQEGPEITHPAGDLSLSCSDSDSVNLGRINAWIMSHGGAVATDCTGVVWSPSTPLYSMPTGFSGTCPQTMDFVFTAADPCGNAVSTTTGTITLSDTADPTITCTLPGGNCDDQFVECDENTDHNVNQWLAMNGNLACNDDCGSATFDPTPMLVSDDGLDCNRTKIYRFTCRDTCGNSVTKQVPIQIRDTQPPQQIETPLSGVYECDGTGNNMDRQAFIAMWGGGGRRWANDACSPNPQCSPDYRSEDVCTYCAATYSPVCAGGQTYPNSCYAYCNGHHSFYSGACPVVPPTNPPTYYVPPTNPPYTATMPPTTQPPSQLPTPSGGADCTYCGSEYSPVCVGGTQQYDNYCHAYCHDHWHFTVGPCGTSHGPECEDYCGDYSSYVCGKDGVTYPSACHAACAGIYEYTAGRCAFGCGESPLDYGYIEGISPDPSAPPGCRITPFVFNATDPCGNTVISNPVNFVVQDTKAPVITVAKDTKVECDGNGNVQQYNDWLASYGGATCVDQCSGDLTAVPSAWNVVNRSFVQNGFTGACGTSCPMDTCTTATFTCVDNCGRSQTTSARFVIADSTPPTIDIAGTGVRADECTESSLTNNMATRWANCMNVSDCPYLGPQAIGDSTDMCSDPIVITNLKGTKPVSFPLIQRSGFKVIPPRIPYGGVIGERPGDLPQSERVFIMQRIPYVQFTERCPIITTLEAIAEDACENQSPMVVAYHVYFDNTPPVFAVTPMDLTVECDSTTNAAQFAEWLDTAGGAVCSDSCGIFGADSTTVGPVNPSVSMPEMPPCPTSQDVEFFCEDYCGNRVTYTATFTVADTTPPLISPVDDQTVNCGPRDNEGRFLNWLERQRLQASVSDSCSRKQDLTVSANAGSCRYDGFCFSVLVAFIAKQVECKFSRYSCISVKMGVPGQQYS